MEAIIASHGFQAVPIMQMVFDGVVQPYDMTKLNDRLKEESLPSSPDKPGRLQEMISTTVRGTVYSEAKQRNPARAFLHIITWSEMKPFLPRLAAAGVECAGLEAVPEIEADGTHADFSWDDIAQIHPAITQVLTEILLARHASLKRGDAVRMQFIGYRCYGIYFWDGKHVIPPEEEDSDYFGLPSAFKVPTEFALDYWDDVGFVGWSHHGDYCFDVAAVQGRLTERPLAINDYRSLTYATASVGGQDWYFIFSSENFIASREKKDWREPGLLRQFLRTGRCFNGDHDLEFEDAELEAALARVGLSWQAMQKHKRLVIIA